MIIKNNFNEKDANPLSDYKSVSKTRDNNFDTLDEGVDKQVIEDIIAKDHEFDGGDSDEGDNWDFFR